MQAVVFASALVALAGPYVVAPRATRTSTLVVADRTGAAAPFADDVAAAAEAALIEALAAGDVRLLTWGDGDVRVVGDVATPAEAATAARRLPPPRGVRDPESLLRTVVAGVGVARVVVVSPYATDVGEGAAPWALRPAGGGEIPKNGGLRGVEAAGAFVRVRVAGGAGRTVRLLDGDRVLAEAAAGDVVDLPAPTSRPEAPRLVLTPPDPWPEDDGAALELTPLRRLRVLLAAEEATAVAAALEASGLADAARSSRVAATRWREAAAGYDVVALVGRDEAAPLPPGRYLLFDATAPGVPLVRGGATAAASRPARAPWPAGVDLDAWGADGAGWTATAEADVLAEGARGPLVVRWRNDATRGFALLGSPDLGRSAVPASAAFPVVVRAALLELAGAASVQVVRALDPAALRAPIPEGLRPAVATAAASSGAPTPGAPPSSADRRSLRTPVLCVLGAALLLEWLLHHAGLTD